ncbi:helix-turn-helix domain-containing protein [Rhodococcus ruber]|uniref:helix-turn-helix domain-containing protein n=1 Tax=Rhodococcus ruber TaxID=1830 RepID=UPI00177B7C47|nr:helix-turn-helix domain-containing protein [Rhodococcus ruber]MBD8057251.1 helix-turn-helix domain-containing protein [Rhodococcus ruber]
MTAKKPARRKITAREAAEQFGVSERTIRRLVAEPRAEFEARAAERRNRAVAMREAGATYQEIADDLGITTGTVGTILRRARKYAAKAAQQQ